MLKVMIVDDEVFVRIGIRSSIDWEKNGFEVVAEAADGQQALESIIMGYVDSGSEIEQLIRQYNLELPLQSYYVLRVRVDQGASAERFHENKILCKTLLGLLRDAVAQQCCGEVVQCGSDAFAALAYPREAVSEQQAGKAVAALGNLIICTVSQALGLKISIGISNPHHGAEFLAQAGKEAREALNMRFFSQNGDRVFFASHTPEPLAQEQPQDRPRMQKGVQALCDALTCGDRESIVRAVEEVRAELREKRMDEVYARLYFTKMYLAVFELMESVGQPFDDVRQRCAGLENIVLYGNSLEEIAARVQEAALEAADSYAEFKRRRKSDVITQVIDYVDQNYAENISLSLISQKFNINSAYFCKLFKQVTDKTFVEYLTQRRIAAAQKLLRETDLRSYMIAKEVGFMNVEYFSKVFHNQAGMSPKEYRNHCRQSVGNG